MCGNISVRVHGSLPTAAPPNTTAPPTELSTTNIPVCCAGVQLNLAKPDDPSIQVWVLVDGTLHPANQVTRNGSFLYIMGLQAGTEDQHTWNSVGQHHSQGSPW